METNNKSEILPDSAENATALIEALKGSSKSGALGIAQNFDAFFRYIGREASRKREQSYIEPFICVASDVSALHNAVTRLLTEFGIEESPLFDCSIGLESRRVVSCQDPYEIGELTDSDQSRPLFVHIV